MTEPEYQYAPIERPILAGGPYSPVHATWRRCIYAVIALLAAVAASLGNALVSTNVTSIAGSLGEYVAVVALLPAFYVAMNATGNLSVVKSRVVWGIPIVNQTLLTGYAAAALLQVIYPTFAWAVVVRAASGLSAAALITASTFYLFQVFPPKLRPLALVVGLGLVQLGIPIARLFPVEALARAHWRALHLTELAIPLVMLAAMTLFPLPPSDRRRAFERLDFLTIGLLVPSMLLICIILSAGRWFWWTDTPWLGWTLAAALPLLAAALLIELNRRRPLLFLDWIGTPVMLRFVAVAFLMRLALAEQTYGSVGLLTASGLTNEQLRLLFLGVAGAMVLGIATAALTLHPQRLRQQVIAAALCIAWGAWLDSHATNLTRPHELYLSQALLGFGTTLFIGPALAFGFIRMIERGPEYFVSLIVTFSTTQNVGSLAGAALLGTYQVAATRAHASALTDHLVGADPQVAARIQAGAQLLSGTLTDPAQQAAQGAALLAQAQTREATVLAFNDVFSFVALLALGTAMFVTCLVLRDLWRARRQIPQGAAA